MELVFMIRLAFIGIKPIGLRMHTVVLVKRCLIIIISTVKELRPTYGTELDSKSFLGYAVVSLQLHPDSTPPEEDGRYLRRAS